MGLQRLPCSDASLCACRLYVAHESPPWTSPPSLPSRSLSATRSLNRRRSIDETLQTIAEVTRNSVPGFNEVGISTL